MVLTVNEIARRLGSRRLADSSTAINRIAPLGVATAGDLSFLPHPRMRKQLSLCRASAVITDSDAGSSCRAESIIVEDCLLGCARAAQWLEHFSREFDARWRPVQHYEAADPTADIASSVVVGRATTIGPHSIVRSGCVIGDGVRIGAYCDIGPNVTLNAAATIGNRVVIGANSVIGGDPFLYVRDGVSWLKLPSFGSVEVGDDVTIGSNSAIDRGALGDTRIGRGTKLDNLVHIGHGSVVGEHCAIAAHTAIAGEVTIGEACIIGGAVGVAEGISIAPRVRITGMSMVTNSLRVAGESYSSGWPARPSRRWWRLVARTSRQRDI